MVAPLDSPRIAASSWCRVLGSLSVSKPCLAKLALLSPSAMLRMRLSATRDCPPMLLLREVCKIVFVHTKSSQ